MTTLVKVSIVSAICALGGTAYLYATPVTADVNASVKQPASGQMTVKVIQPTLVSERQPVQFNARVEAIEQSSIFSRADGYLDLRQVDIGDTVKKGDVLAVLAAPELEKSINQAKAEIKRQQAVVALSKKLAERYTSLRNSGAVNATEVDEKEAEYAVAVATLTTVDARLDELQNEYAYLRIEAPFDGVITRRYVERGDRITRNDTTPLFQISRQDTLRVIADIPQTQLFDIDQQQAKLVLPETNQAEIEVTLSRSSGEIDPQTGTMRVEYLLDNQHYALPTGLRGQLSIPRKQAVNLYQIPINTLKIVNGKNAVMIVNDQQQIELRPVTLGKLNTTLVEVRAGLKPTDRVILNPNARLSPGVTVNAE